jgi:hypothetical protein
MLKSAKFETPLQDWLAGAVQCTKNYSGVLTEGEVADRLGLGLAV